MSRDGGRGPAVRTGGDRPGRHAPVLVLLTGGVLGVGAAAFGLASTGDVPRSAVTGLAFLYPAAAYAVRHDDDPTGVLPPRPVAVSGCLLGLALPALLVGGHPSPGLGTALYGLTLGLAAALPPLGYAAVYGTPPAWLRPRRTAAATTAAAGLLCAAAVASDAPGFGGAAALATFLAGSLYAHRRGLRLRRRTRRAAVLAGIVAGAACGVLAAAGARPAGLATVGIVAALGPGLAVALTAPRRGRDGGEDGGRSGDRSG